MAEIVFLNRTRINGVEWAQIEGRFPNIWWRTDAPAFYAGDDEWSMDVEGMTEAQARMLAQKGQAYGPLVRKTRELAEAERNQAAQRNIKFGDKPKRTMSWF